MRYLIVLAALASTVPVYAVARSIPTKAYVDGVVAAPVTTYHSGLFGGQRVTYAATVGETVYRSSTGRPTATIFSVSYVRTDVSDPARRPVLFAFNGGPGSSSDELQLAFGPRRSSQSTGVHAVHSQSDKMVDNPDSLIPVADLVFIDPVGTGFSRVLPGGHGAPYWNTIGDARSVAYFIRKWLRRNNRSSSPVFICGESYGGMRLGTILGSDAKGIPVVGAIFLSPAVDLTDTFEAPGNDMPFIMAFPGEAAIAWYHKRAYRKARTVVQVFDDAKRFAQTSYMEALFQGSRLSDQERRKIARQVAVRIGIPVKIVLRDDLRVPISQFVADLLADKGLRVGRTDGRYVGVEAKLAKKHPPFNDPSISPGGSDAGLMRRYLVNDLGFKTKRRYITLAMNVNSRWKWNLSNQTESYSNVVPSVGVAMNKASSLRLFVAGGYYDLAVPLMATIYAFDHANVPKNRITEKFYESGHILYQSASVRRQLTTDIRAFVVRTTHEARGS